MLARQNSLQRASLSDQHPFGSSVLPEQCKALVLVIDLSPTPWTEVHF